MTVLWEPNWGGKRKEGTIYSWSSRKGCNSEDAGYPA